MHRRGKQRAAHSLANSSGACKSCETTQDDGYSCVLAAPRDALLRYGLELVQAAGIVGYASEAKSSLPSNRTASGDNPFDAGPGGVNSKASVGNGSSNTAPGFDASVATCLLTSMFREDFADAISRCSRLNMCGRSLVGQCLHNLSMPHAQLDR
jgi:hypothetical protein